MFKNLSLNTKTFLLLVFLVALAVLPLIVYYNKTASALAQLASDPDIEKGLLLSLDLAQEPDQSGTAGLALKKYGQIQALKSSILKEVLLFTLFYFLVVIVLSLLVGYFFISRITRPLLDLTRATRELANDNLDIRLNVPSGGEIGRLQDAFRKMVEDLKTARDERALAERRATWQNVARTIAHEIKNPLTPIKLSTERMYDKYLNESRDFPQVIKSTTETILSEIGNLQKLVDTFHQYAKFPDPILQEESLNTIAEETLALFAGETTAVRRELDPSLPALMLDKGQIKQALFNLVKNSLQSLEEIKREGRVLVKTQYAEHRVFLMVEDNGCGISEENRKRLFQPYFTTKQQGSGIGLALTERIVNLHGGKILCTSREGEGTLFKIILPVKDASLAETRTGIRIPSNT